MAIRIIGDTMTLEIDRTSPAVNSVSLTQPSSSFNAFTIVPRYHVTARAESPSTP